MTEYSTAEFGPLYDAGRMAALSGAPFRSCPYACGEGREDWLIGFLAARQTLRIAPTSSIDAARQTPRFAWPPHRGRK